MQRGNGSWIIGDSMKKVNRITCVYVYIHVCVFKSQREEGREGKGEVGEGKKRK